MKKKKILMYTSIISMILLSVSYYSVLGKSNENIKVYTENGLIDINEGDIFIDNKRTMIKYGLYEEEILSLSEEEQINFTKSLSSDEIHYSYKYPMNNHLTIKEDAYSVNFIQNKKEYYVNDEKLKMDVKVENINGDLFVPLRYFAEAFGQNVEWNKRDSSITIKKEPITLVEKYGFDVWDVGYNFFDDELKNIEGLLYKESKNQYEDIEYIKITSKEQLDELKKLKEIVNGYNPLSDEKINEKYDDEYFEKSYLLMNSVYQGVGMPLFSLEDIIIYNEKINIFTKDNVEPLTTRPAVESYYSFNFDIPKEYLDYDVNFILDYNTGE